MVVALGAAGGEGLFRRRRAEGRGRPIVREAVAVWVFVFELRMGGVIYTFW